jgi:hypothetical protein
VLDARIPSDQRTARRVFIGRDTTGAAVLKLSDRAGVPRLQFTVDSLGRASISFLDARGKITRTIGDSSSM